MYPIYQERQGEFVSEAIRALCHLSASRTLARNTVQRKATESSNAASTSDETPIYLHSQALHDATRLFEDCISFRQVTACSKSLVLRTPSF